MEATQVQNLLLKCWVLLLMFDSMHFKAKHAHKVGKKIKNKKKKRKCSLCLSSSYSGISFPCSLVAGMLQAQCNGISATLKFSKLLAALCCSKHCFSLGVSWLCCKKVVFPCWLNSMYIREKSGKEPQEEKPGEKNNMLEKQ